MGEENSCPLCGEPVGMFGAIRVNGHRYHENPCASKALRKLGNIKIGIVQKSERDD